MTIGNLFWLEASVPARAVEAELHTVSLTNLWDILSMSLLCTVGLLAATVVRAAPLYTVTDLGSFGEPWGQWASSGNGINNFGQATGSASIPEPGGARHAFLFSNGSLIDLGPFVVGGQGSSGLGINDSGDVVGSASFKPSPGGANGHAFMWSNGTMTDIGTLGGSTSNGLAINNARVVAGSSYIAGDTAEHAFVWNGSTMRDIHPFANGFSRGNAINEAGWVAGFGAATAQHYHPTLWTNDEVLDLGTLGGYYGFATGINDRGQVTGGSTTFKDKRENAFLWDNGTMINLLTLGGDFSRGNAINALGQVTGFSYTADKELHAALWSGGTIYDLNTVLDPASSGWTIEAGNGINDSGQIVGYGFDRNGIYHALILTPDQNPPAIPEPATLSLLLAGLCTVGFMTHRRKT